MRIRLFDWRGGSLSQRHNRRTGMLGLGVLSGIFVIVGLTLFTTMTVKPVFRWWSAQSWETTTCTILSSDIQEHRSDDSTTYSIAISYRYTYPPNEKGKDYTSEQVDFANGSSSGRQAKAELVAQYPEGSTAECFIDPENPADAILIRDFQLSYLFGLIGLLFAGIGAAVFYSGLRNARKGLSGRGSYVQAVPEANSQCIKLRPTQGRLIKFIIIVIVALFWNGLVGLIFGSQWKDGDISGIGPLLFALLFVGIGLGIVAYAVYCFLALFNPHPHLTLKPGTIPLGEMAELSWRFDRRVDRIRKLEVYLLGVESARYRQGTKTYTSHNEFERILIFETEEPREMAQGTLQVGIPEFTIHTFKATNNNVEWTLHIEGDIAFWPDIKDSYEIMVLPMHALDQA